jgi:uncharacterized protein involved in tolerance to divalent cations
MTAKILSFPNGAGEEGVTAKGVLEAAVESELAQCVVIGWSADDGFYLDGNTNKPDEVLLLLEAAKSLIMDAVLNGA